MPRRDRLDPTLAKHFAWTFARPGERVRLGEKLRAAEEAASQATSTAIVAREATSIEPPPGDRDVDVERSRSKARAACRALATAVAETWAQAGPGVDGADPTAAVAAVKRLVVRADRLGIELLELGEWPVDAVRLLRLFVRFASKLTRRQRERCGSIATLVPLDHPEAAELFVEVACAADRVLADALLADDEWAPEGPDPALLVARLADVVDHGPSHLCRVIAIAFIERIERRGPSVAALQRALRLPSFAVRAHALHALATAHPCAVAPEDLVHVLRDLVAHDVPDTLVSDENEENERIFAEAVLVALEHASSDDAAEALLDWIDAERETLWLDAGWATEALAVAFPETAAAMVDHWLQCARAHDRSKALAALDRLPDELAQPRLLRAASDPAPALREGARAQWLRRFVAVCPVELKSLVGASLLEGPPSERFAARLLVLNGRVAEARQAMARAVLGEAPDREALVLLLQYVGDDGMSGEPLAAYHTHPGELGAREDAPASGSRGPIDWAATVARRFGQAGVEGLCALAARFPEPESFGWMRRLGDLVERGVISRENAGPVRDLAARHVVSEDAGLIDDALRVLSLLGAPPELLDRALGLALDIDLGSPAAHDLIVGWPGRTVDARLASQMALALAERDWPRLQRAASLALGRGSPAAQVIAHRVLELAEEEESAVDAASECARRLRELGRLDEAWANAALGRTDRPVFAVAARVWRNSPAARLALEAALSSTSRRGASRAEAAIALLWADPPLSPRDRRLGGALSGAPPPLRAELVHAMCVRGAPLAQVASHLREMLASPDPEVTQHLVGVAQWLRSAKGQALLRAALPQVVDADLRADLEEELGTAAAPYWAEG